MSIGLTKSELFESGYTLVRESRWSLLYRRETCLYLVSKIQQDGFEFSQLKNINPSDLDESEKNDAAIALFGAHLNPEVPEAWRQLSLSLCQRQIPEESSHLSSKHATPIRCPLFTPNQMRMTLTKWEVANGDDIFLDKTICIIQSGSDQFELVSFNTGKINIFVKEGGEISVGDLIAEVIEPV